jgi:hypothetical protein
MAETTEAVGTAEAAGTVEMAGVAAAMPGGAIPEPTPGHLYAPLGPIPTG